MSRDSDGTVALADLLDRLLDTGALISGDLLITLGGIDLVHLDLRALLTSVESAHERRDARLAAGGTEARSAAPDGGGPHA